MQPVLVVAGEEHLHAEADAQERAAGVDVIGDGRVEVRFAKPDDGVAERADAGQHDLRGLANAVRVAGDLAAWPTCSNAFWTLRRFAMP